MKPNKEKYIDFIISQLQAGNVKFAEVLPKFMAEYSLSKSTFPKYWKLANARFSEIRETVQTELLKETTSAAKKQLKKAILNKDERMQEASKIARGEVLHSGAAPLVPTVTERIKALEYLSKIDGDFAPVKQDLTTNGKEIKSSPFMSEQDEKDYEEYLIKKYNFKRPADKID